jgi:hypothetical protein
MHARSGWIGLAWRARDIVTIRAMNDENARKVGYRRPPTSTRFAKGRSGNPAGRPRGRHKTPPYDNVLGRMVKIRENGRECRVSAERAFLLQLAKRGIEGDAAAARASLELIGRATSREDPDRIKAIVIVGVRPGSVTSAVETLRMGVKLDPHRETCRMVLEPWIVEAALRRLPHQLTPDQQRVVVAAARTPKKVRWPDWWSVHP